jgi:hypothetical protein
MPVSTSEVMLTEKIVPNGVWIGRPPLYGFDRSPEWHGMQSAARAR